MEAVSRIMEADLIYPETAVAISWLETGGWNPRHRIVKNHNWFAIKRGSYCVYSGPDDSIADYRQLERRWIDSYQLHTEELYRRWVRRHYATDPLYGFKLRRAIRITNPYVHNK